MNLFDLQDVIHAELDGNWEDFSISKITMNSKEIEKGDAFFIYGNGYQYIEEAISLGASVIITDRDCEITEVPILKVKNVLETLSILGRKKRETFSGTVIAITGSNGKTSTKELLKFFLSKKYSVLASEDNENNHIGVPKTLLKLNSHYDIAIIEMGMNHAGEIKFLSSIAQPNIGIITNIGTAHIGNLGSQENIFKAKMEIVEACPNITLFVNGLDPFLQKVKAHPVFLEYQSSLPIPAINVNLACKVSEFLGFKKEELHNYLKEFPGVKSRMQTILCHSIIVIDDSYNASYESISYGMKELQKYIGRKIIILGDVLELGKFSREIHQKIYQEIIQYPNIFLVTIGKETGYLNHTPHFSTVLECEEYFHHFSFQENDIIYLKASHKMELSKLVSYFQKNL